jgi:hypothetical protein
MSTPQLDSSDINAIDALMDAWTAANDRGDANSGGGMLEKSDHSSAGTAISRPSVVSAISRAR